MEDNGVIYSRDIQIKTGGGQYKNKRITIIQTMKGYSIKLLDKEDIFYYKTLSISQMDYEINYKKEQSIMAEFNEFPGLVIEMLNKAINSLTGFYLELSESPSTTKLKFCEYTQLRCITHLELMLGNERMEEIRHNILHIIFNNRIELQQSESARCILMETIRHNEKIIRLLEIENNYLYENQLHCRAQAVKLAFKNQQKIEEVERVHLETFHCFQKEKEEELRSLRITNKSLCVLNRILETENALIKNKLWNENKKLKSTIEAKEQVDKDLKILKVKITKYTKELKDIHEHVPLLKKEISRLKKTEQRIEKLEENCFTAKKAFDNSSRKLKECENVLLDQAIKMQAMTKTIQILKKEEVHAKTANALMCKKMKMNSDVIVDLRNKLQNKCSELENRNKIIVRLESENKILQQKVLDLQYEIDFILKQPLSTTNLDKNKKKESLTTYLRDKYQVPDTDLATKGLRPKELERNKMAKLTEDLEKNTLNDL